MAASPIFHFLGRGTQNEQPPSIRSSHSSDSTSAPPFQHPSPPGWAANQTRGGFLPCVPPPLLSQAARPPEALPVFCCHCYRNRLPAGSLDGRGWQGESRKLPLPGRQSCPRRPLLDFQGKKAFKNGEGASSSELMGLRARVSGQGFSAEGGVQEKMSQLATPEASQSLANAQLASHGRAGSTGLRASWGWSGQNQVGCESTFPPAVQTGSSLWLQQEVLWLCGEVVPHCTPPPGLPQLCLEPSGILHSLCPPPLADIALQGMMGFNWWDACMGWVLCTVGFAWVRDNCPPSREDN